LYIQNFSKKKKKKKKKKKYNKKRKKEKKKKKKEHNDGKLIKKYLDCLQHWLMVLIKPLKPTNNFLAFISFFS